MNDLERIRTGAVGLKVEPELLTLFSAGREEKMQIPTREGETHVFVYYPKEAQEQYPLFINLHGGGFVKGHREQDLVYCTGTHKREHGITSLCSGRRTCCFTAGTDDYSRP